MDIKDNEELFAVLNLLRDENPVYTEELIEKGYLDNTHTPTEKAKNFIIEYMDSKMNLLYEAIKNQGSYSKDKGFVLLQAGIKDPNVAELIMEELVRQRKLKKKAGWGYIIRKGENH